MTKTSLIITTLFTASLSGPAHTLDAMPGYELDGNWLKTMCTAPKSVDLLIGYCTGYIWGVMPNVDTKCIPGGVSHEQLIPIVTNYLNDHPERLHIGGQFIVQEAIRNAFPCKE